MFQLFRTSIGNHPKCQVCTLLGSWKKDKKSMTSVFLPRRHVCVVDMNLQASSAESSFTFIYCTKSSFSLRWQRKTVTLASQVCTILIWSKSRMWRKEILYIYSNSRHLFHDVSFKTYNLISAFGGLERISAPLLGVTCCYFSYILIL